MLLKPIKTSSQGAAPAPFSGEMNMFAGASERVLMENSLLFQSLPSLGLETGIHPFTYSRWESTVVFDY